MLHIQPGSYLTLNTKSSENLLQTKRALNLFSVAARQIIQSASVLSRTAVIFHYLSPRILKSSL